MSISFTKVLAALIWSKFRSDLCSRK